jgi:hypothetical protein
MINFYRKTASGKIVIIFLIFFLFFINPNNLFSEENGSQPPSSIEERLEKLESILNQMEKKQKAEEVMNELEQTEEEKKEEEEDILDAAGREYTLATPGTVSLSYGISYSGDTYDQLKQIEDEDGNTSTKVRHVNSHSLNNSLSLKYPLLNNLTLSSSFSYALKYSDSKDQSKTGTGIGDPGLTVQYQPFKPRTGVPTTIVSAGINFPLGSNPYETDEDELATGDGGYSMSFGANFSQTIDPVMAYGGISYYKNFAIDGLSYNSDQDQKDQGLYIYKIKPGESIGANIGMGYSLSYLVSLSVGFSYSYSFPSDYYWKNAGKNSSSGGYSSSVSIGTNWKISHKRSVRTTLSLGLFSNNSDVSFSLSVPFDFKI